MKRPTRPFVVEVKKKRRNPAKKRSIWGDLDLSAAAADTSNVSESKDGPSASHTNIGLVGMNDHSGDSEAPIVTNVDSDGPALADEAQETSDLGEIEAGSGIASSERLSRTRGRHQDEPSLPRGQRWKRLPKLLRR